MLKEALDKKILFSSIFILSCILAHFKIYDFPVSYQVTSYFGTKEYHKPLRKIVDIKSLSTEELVKSGNAPVGIPSIFHAPRAWLCYPSFFLANFTDLDIHKIFTFQIIILILLHLIIVNSLILNYLVEFKERLDYFFLLYALGYLVMCTRVNGRIIFIHLGVSLFLHLIFSSNNLRKYVVSLFVLTICLWLTSVSSGTYLVFYTLMFFSFLIINEKSYRFAVLSTGLIGIYHIFLGFKKNLGHYGGSIINMANHGWGRYLFDFPLLSLICFGVLVYLIYKLKKKKVKISNYIKDYKSLTVYFFATISILVSLFGNLVFWGGLLSYYFILSEYFIKRNQLKIARCG